MAVELLKMLLAEVMMFVAAPRANDGRDHQELDNEQDHG
jgi:hypothetical protein